MPSAGISVSTKANQKIFIKAKAGDENRLLLFIVLLLNDALTTQESLCAIIFRHIRQRRRRNQHERKYE